MVLGRRRRRRPGENYNNLSGQEVASDVSGLSYEPIKSQKVSSVVYTGKAKKCTRGESNPKGQSKRNVGLRSSWCWYLGGHSVAAQYSFLDLSGQEVASASGLSHEQKKREIRPRERPKSALAGSRTRVIRVLLAVLWVLRCLSGMVLLSAVDCCVSVGGGYDAATLRARNFWLPLRKCRNIYQLVLST